ncbi:MAG: hypothetical protein A2Z34_09775 [Planctomycetes bacterium RBG_16_59_8]|nr:MAG: hypothetical protein A2Z34_09775 [Planctomycetes bacterium RBG_16_59_8]
MVLSSPAAGPAAVPPTRPPEVEEAARREKNIFGRYILIEKIGQGGMGVVYRAWDTTLNRPCAVKTLLPNLDAESDVTYREQAERFLREAQTAAKLSHPNIVQVYDVGAVGDVRYIAMEYVPGKTLKKYRDRITTEEKKGGSTSRLLRDRLEQTLWIMHDTIKAVGHAHAQGIVHRDVKPENIFLASSGEKIVPKVGDFGLAKEIGESRRITLSGTAVGTPYYMSPEQAEGRRQVDARSDVFSLGSVLYEMTTGKTPFEGEGVVEIMRSVVEKDPLPPRKLNPAIDEDMQTIILKALEKEPRRRYADGEAFADDLKRYLLDETIRARPATLVYRIGKKLRRHRVASSLIGSILLLLLLVGSYAILSGLKQKEKVRGLETEKGRVEGEKAQAEKDREIHDRAAKIAMQGWMIVSEVTAEFYKKETDMGKVWKRLEAAVGKLDESIAIRPTAPAHFYCGRVALLRMDYDRAEKDFTDAAALDKEFAEAFVFRGIVHMSKFAEQYVDPRHRKEFRRSGSIERLSDAVEDLRRISGSAVKDEYQPFRRLVDAFALLDESNPQPSLDKMNEGYQTFKREEFLYWAGVVEYIRNNAAKVKDLLSQALEIRPQYPEAIALLACLEADDDKQIELFSKAIAINPRFASASMNRGDVFEEKKEYAAALEDFNTVVRLRPQWAVAYEHRGSLRNGMGDPAGALEDFGKAIELAPTWAHLYAQRGEISSLLGFRAKTRDPAKAAWYDTEAARDFETALKIDPNDASAYYHRGRMKTRRNDQDGAIADFTKGLQLKPSVNLYASRAGAREAKKDLRGAIEDYTAAIALETHNFSPAGLHHSRGRLYWELNEQDNAIADYTRSLQLSPKSAGVLYDRGVARMYKKDLNGAVGDYNRALELDPDYILALYFRGRCRLGLGDHDGAIGDLTRAIEIDPKFTVYFYNEALARLSLGDARGAKGDLVGAIAEWKRALELAPSLKKELLPRVKRAEERLKEKGL